MSFWDSKVWDWLLVVFTIIAIISLAHYAFSQTPQDKQVVLTPTELEQAKLAKFKAQDEIYKEQLRTIESEMNSLRLSYQIVNQQEKQKQSEFLGYSEEVKRNHNKDWGDGVIFYSEKGESGSFEKVK